MVLAGSFINFDNKFPLLFDITILLCLSRLESFRENFVSVKHWKPFQTRHKLIDDFANLVPVGDASNVDLYVIFAQQTLRLKVKIFDVQTALTQFSPGLWTISWNCFIEKVWLLKAFRSIHCLFDAVLNLTVEEDSILAGI